MAKSKSAYICSECGYESPKWYGKCPGCGEWNTMNEEIITPTAKAVEQKVRVSSSYSKPLKLDEINTTDEFRYKTGIGELDNVLGGGIVKGSIDFICSAMTSTSVSVITSISLVTPKRSALSLICLRDSSPET